jgi:hypothetical protein
MEFIQQYNENWKECVEKMSSKSMPKRFYEPLSPLKVLLKPA